MALPPLNIISLCTGGAGLDLGIELAMPTARPVCLVEREAFAVARLVSAMQQGLLADAPVWSDVRTFDGRKWRGLVDGLIGGIPCQPHSLAGKRKGQDDERDLWSAARRIIVQSGAWFVLIENVGGMLSSGGAERLYRDFQRLGFTSEVGLFTSAEVGASHQRERLFWLAVADGRSARLAVRQQSEIQRGNVRHEGPPAAACRDGVADAEGAERRTEQQASGAGRGRTGLAGDCAALADADFALVRRQPPTGQLAELQQDDGNGARHFPIFPPGPSDLAAWRTIAATDPDGLPALSRHDRFELALRNAGIDPPRHASGKAGRAPKLHAAVVSAAAERHLRGKTDGMASRLDQLRLLGNGVCSLQAAYAFRTLVTRLADRGSAGAGELVRMMEHGLSASIDDTRVIPGSGPATGGNLNHPACQPTPTDPGAGGTQP